MNIIMASTTYDVVTNDRKYTFTLPANAPMGEAYDVMYKFMSLIANNIKNTTEAVERKEEKTTSTEEVKETK